jgi:organic hydroperoxide reductase OsmC/OhrA
MSEEREFAVELRLEEDYRFGAAFADMANVPELLFDEPEPLGAGAGPNAARVLGAAIGNCLAASLLFCLRRARVEVTSLNAHVHGRIARNEQGRFRIAGISVRLEPVVAAADRDRLGRCLELFEDFCIVTGSVRSGIDVEVDVALPA